MTCDSGARRSWAWKNCVCLFVCLFICFVLFLLFIFWNHWIFFGSTKMEHIRHWRAPTVSCWQDPFSLNPSLRWFQQNGVLITKGYYRKFAKIMEKKKHVEIKRTTAITYVAYFLSALSPLHRIWLQATRSWCFFSRTDKEAWTFLSNYNINLQFSDFDRIKSRLIQKQILSGSQFSRKLTTYLSNYNI